jgi:hypothetical protein
MSPYWLHPDGRLDGARRLRPRNHGPFPDGPPRGNGHWIAGEWVALADGIAAAVPPGPDQVLALRVAEALVRDEGVRGRRLEVTVSGTVVILDGEIESPDARTAAGICVRSTPGVSEVVNRLIVG